MRCSLVRSPLPFSIVAAPPVMLWSPANAVLERYPDPMDPADCPDLCALKAGELAAWRAAWPCFWAIALQAARHPRTGLVRWEAEDVASEAIEELITRIDTASTIPHAKALLATIASRRAIDFARRKSAEKRRAPTSEQPDAYTDSSMSLVEQAELVLLVQNALEALDPETRALLMEKIGQQLTYREISNRHGLPMGTVCTKVARALAKVRETLQQSSVQMKELRAFLR